MERAMRLEPTTHAAARNGTARRRLANWVKATGLLAAVLASDIIGLTPAPIIIATAEARVGHPLTPFSYAGLARRVTRRAIRRSVLFYGTLPPACIRTSISG